MTRYERTQVGWVVICGLCIALTIVAIKIRNESVPAREISIGIEPLLLLTLVVFYKLTIKIDNHVLRISFGAGVVGKTVQLTEIDTYEPVRIRWWYGWGFISHRTAGSTTSRDGTQWQSNCATAKNSRSAQRSLKH